MGVRRIPRALGSGYPAAGGVVLNPHLGQGKALLEQARRESSSWSRNFVASVLAAVRESNGAAPDRGARHRAALSVAEQFGEAAQAFRSAIDSGGCEQAYKGLAEALEGQGTIFATLGPGSEAEALRSFYQADAALDAARGLTQDVDLLRVQARLLRTAGDVHARLHEWVEAAGCYRKAADLLEALVQAAPGDPKARIRRGEILSAFASLGARGTSPAWSPVSPENPDESMGRHGAALSALDEALEFGADRLAVLIMKADVLRSQGDLQRSLSRRRAALDSYRQAVRLLDEAVAEHAGQRRTRGRMLERAGDVARELGRSTEAVWSYERGVADLESAIGPVGYDEFSRGSMLVRLGALYLGAGRIQEARASLERGLEVLVATSGITEEDKLARDRLINHGRGLLTG